MSKRRRDRGESNDDLLGEMEQTDTPLPTAEPTLSEFANAGYGSRVGNEVFPELNKGRVKVSLTAINAIVPDPSQPRRTIPSRIRQYWDGKSEFDSMGYLFEMWLKEVQIERGGTAFDIGDYLTSGITDRTPAEFSEVSYEKDASNNPRVSAIEWSLLKVIALATSIRRDGLTNPVTVVERNNSFMLETGERRWLAFHLLHWYFGQDDQDWSKIPARVMERLSIWRQATENNARADLNAIAKARQLALLIMDLYTTEVGTQFRSFEIFKSEQAFYAQVADPIQYKIPYGRGELILNAMGFENKSTIKRYRDLLSLPPDVWIRADDYNVPESVLRQMINRPFEQQMGLIDMWRESGKLPNEERQGMVFEPRVPKQFGKFSRLVDYEIQQWRGEFEDLEQDSQRVILQFLKDLVAELERR